MSFPGDAWRLAWPYWRSEERWRARLLLALIVALTLALVFILVLLNDWNRQFYEAIQDRDFAAFGPLLLRFSVLAALYIVGAVYKLYFTQMLEIGWRVWLTRQFVSSWLNYRVYYRLELDPGGTDNPDQRIADDLRLFTTSTLELSLGFLSSAVTLASFVAILWGISGPLSLAFGPLEGSIPGYMVWAALLYAFVGSLAARYVGRPLIGLNFQQQRFEADFRFGLVRVRENAEGIALYRGERFEGAQLQGNFERIRANWWALMRATKRLMFFTVGYNQAAVIFPILVAAPRYFSGAITLGVLMQIANAFGQVQGALSWFVDSYAALASWKATTDRLLTFESSVRTASVAALHPELAVYSNSADDLCAEHVDLRLPNGALVLANGTFCIKPGERVLLSGPNGSGKSLLFRAIAGIWPFGHGRIYAPATNRLLFLPQRPYIPIAPLREAVSYPARALSFGDEEIRAALRTVKLERFADRLDDLQNWGMQMSGGEQQRLAIARALLHRPEWLFLDEATAALDEDGERELYELLRERLSASTIVSIAHRSQVADYHGTRLILAAPASGGPSSLLACPAAASEEHPAGVQGPTGDSRAGLRASSRD
jgi:vitamin B12/bleomycin/antimicrobial peptide transport system ATP-binding/permease protein